MQNIYVVTFLYEYIHHLTFKAWQLQKHETGSSLYMLIYIHINIYIYIHCIYIYYILYVNYIYEIIYIYINIYKYKLTLKGVECVEWG